MIASLRFAGDLHPTIALGAITMVAAGVVWFYLRETRQLAAPYSYLLPSLRASAVALTLLIAAGPVWHSRQTVGTLGRVLFAIDTSQSMSMTDSGEASSSPTRVDRAVRLLVGEGERQGWIESLLKTHQVDVIGFDTGDPSLIWTAAEQQKSPTALNIDADGIRTDLSIPIGTALASLAPGAETSSNDSQQSPERAAVVLLTDGRSNFGPSPVDVAERFQSAGAKVHAIGLGSQDEPVDVGISDIIRPDSVAIDGLLAGSIQLKQAGVEGQPLSLRIESAGQVVWQRNVMATGTDDQSVPFELDVKSIVDPSDDDTPRGVRRSTVVMDLRAAVEPLDDDTNANNNATSFRVAAAMRDRRLLILDGSSRWEMRYLRNLFDRDPAWTVDTVLFGGGTDQQTVRRGSEPGMLPDSRQAMAQYDAIVLGEVPPEQFDATTAELLRQFVTHGGGLIVLDGQFERIAQLANQSLSDLIPVRFPGLPPTEISEIRPTRMGLEHPMLNLWGQQQELDEFWRRLPAPPVAQRVIAQEGAEVWADLIDADGQPTPWLVTRLFGAGRVFYLSSDQTWRWRYKVADRFHARFWNQLLAAVMQPPYSASDQYVALGTDKVDYETGESANIRARLQDTAGNPVPDATVDALLIADNQIVATVPLAVDDPARGTYQGRTPALASGEFDIRIRASGFDASALQATTPIWVGTGHSVEFGRVSLDQAALRQIVGAGGGTYLHESSADELLQLLRPLSSGTVVESDILIWQSFYWFWAILVLLALEWWLRKRAGLV